MNAYFVQEWTESTVPTLLGLSLQFYEEKFLVAPSLSQERRLLRRDYRFGSFPDGEQQGFQTKDAHRKLLTTPAPYISLGMYLLLSTPS